MSIIHATCGDCGDVELTERALVVRVCVDTQAATYRFRCPECRMVEVRSASPEIVDILLAAGVTLSEWRLPSELEERPLGDPISHDDLLDFHRLLSEENWLDQLVGEIPNS